MTKFELPDELYEKAGCFCTEHGINIESFIYDCVEEGLSTLGAAYSHSYFDADFKKALLDIISSRLDAFIEFQCDCVKINEDEKIKRWNRPFNQEKTGDGDSWLDGLDIRCQAYLCNIVNELINKTGRKSLALQRYYGDKRSALHFYDAFYLLGSIGIKTYHVLTISFSNQSFSDRVGFWGGAKVDIGPFGDGIKHLKTLKLPKVTHREVDFWHFVSAVSI